MKIKQTPLHKKIYYLDLDINPTQIGNTMINGYYPVKDIHLETLPMPIDFYTKESVNGTWKFNVFSNIDKDAKILIPSFYNELKFPIVFEPEDGNKYDKVFSTLCLKLINQPMKLEFSGTRGLWYL